MPTVGPSVSSVLVNGGAPAYTDANGLAVSLTGQSSVVEQILVTFNEAVTLDAGAITVTNIAQDVTVNAGPFPSSLPVTANFAAVAGSGNTQYIVTFSGAGATPITGGTGTVIMDGLYILDTIGSKVHADGMTAANDNYAIFWALYGSVVPDSVTSNGTQEIFVDNFDYSQFRTTFGSESDIPNGPPAYIAAFDSDLNGYIDNTEFAAFQATFGADWSVPIEVVVLNNPGDQTNYDGDPVNLAVSAGDTAGNALTYSATNLPSGLSIDSGTGVISGTIATDADTYGPYTVTVTATDTVEGPSASQAFNWTAVNPISAPHNAEGDTVCFSLSNGPVSDVISYAATGLPPGLAIDTATGVICGTISPGAHANGPYNVNMRATDETDSTASSSDQFSWAVATTGRVVVSMNVPANQTSAEEDTVNLSVLATDSAGNSLVYRALGLPHGLSMNSATGTISGTVRDGDSAQGPYAITITVNDSANAAIGTSGTFLWGFHPAITLANLGTENNADGDTVYMPISAVDSAKNNITFAVSNLPLGLGFDASTGTISGTISSKADTNGPYHLTVTATDSLDSSVSVAKSFQWNIASTGPTVVGLTAISDRSGNDLDNVSLQVSGIDSTNNGLVYNAFNLPPGLTISSTTGLISGQIIAGDSITGTYLVKIAVTDSVNPDVGATDDFAWTVFQDAVLVRGLQITMAPAANAQMDGATVLLPAGPTLQQFNVTFTGTTLNGNEQFSLDWTIMNGTTQIAPTQNFSGTSNAAGNINPNNSSVPFALFSNNAGSIETINLSLQGESFTVTVNAQDVTSAGVPVRGQSWVAEGRTTGITPNTNVTVTITNLGAAGNGTIPSGIMPTTFDFTVNVTGAAANSTVSNIYWSVIEPDSGRDDWLVNSAAISVNTDANGTGSATGQFILFGRNTIRGGNDVAGPDEDSWENPTDPIYVYLQQKLGIRWEIGRSQTFVGRV